MDKEPAILFENVTKDFKTSLMGKYVRAVDGISFEVEEGQVFGLLGPNGSGKSTLMKMVLGLTEASLGKCRVFNDTPQKASLRTRIGYLPEAPYYQKFMTGYEVVRMSALLSGMKQKDLHSCCMEVLRTVEMDEASKRKVGTYSKGMLQRIGFAQAMVHDPDLFVLDEPTAGVDPAGSELIANIILDLKNKGKTVLLCSHLLAEVETICDCIAILQRGKLVQFGAVDELLLAKEKILFNVKSPVELERAKKILVENQINFELQTAKKSLQDYYREHSR